MRDALNVLLQLWYSESMYWTEFVDIIVDLWALARTPCGDFLNHTEKQMIQNEVCGLRLDLVLTSCRLPPSNEYKGPDSHHGLHYHSMEVQVRKYETETSFLKKNLQLILQALPGLHPFKKLSQGCINPAMWKNKCETSRPSKAWLILRSRR